MEILTHEGIHRGVDQVAQDMAGLAIVAVTGGLVPPSEVHFTEGYGPMSPMMEIDPSASETSVYTPPPVIRGLGQLSTLDARLAFERTNLHFAVAA